MLDSRRQRLSGQIGSIKKRWDGFLRCDKYELFVGTL
jgi:hypothetical protein